MSDDLLILYNNLLYSLKYNKKLIFYDKGNDIQVKRINI